MAGHSGTMPFDSRLSETTVIIALGEGAMPASQAVVHVSSEAQLQYGSCQYQNSLQMVLDRYENCSVRGSVKTKLIVIDILLDPNGNENFNCIY